LLAHHGLPLITALGRRFGLAHRLLLPGVMHRRSVLVLAVILAFAPGCKGMGGFANGLGKVAAGAARGVSKVGPAIARGVAKAAPVMARGAVHVVARTAPTALRVTEAVAEAALSMPDVYAVGPAELPAPMDPCNACPARDDDDCGACAGYGGYACMPAPPGAYARCESSAPPDVAPLPAAAPDGTTAASPPAP